MAHSFWKSLNNWFIAGKHYVWRQYLSFFYLTTNIGGGNYFAISLYYLSSINTNWESRGKWVQKQTCYTLSLAALVWGDNVPCSKSANWISWMAKWLASQAHDKEFTGLIPFWYLTWHDKPPGPFAPTPRPEHLQLISHTYSSLSNLKWPKLKIELEIELQLGAI